MRRSLLFLLFVAILNQLHCSDRYIDWQHHALPVRSMRTSRYSSQSQGSKLQTSQLKITLYKAAGEDNDKKKNLVPPFGNVSTLTTRYEGIYKNEVTEDQMKTVGKAVEKLQKVISIRHALDGSFPVNFQSSTGQKDFDNDPIDFWFRSVANYGRCGSMVPKEQSYTVASNELAILVSSNVKLCKDVYSTALAYAGACRYDKDTGRPIMGVIGICKRKGKSESSEISTQVHELLHVLAFSKNNLQLGSRPFPLAMRYLHQEPLDWMTRYGYVTNMVTRVEDPKIVKEARKHFDCPELKGVELESQGGDGTSFAHWEERIFGDEMMVGMEQHEDHTLSRMTLALLDSTGWYEIDYSKSKDLVYGKNRGCEFLDQSCMEYMRKVQLDESLETDYEKWQKTKPYCRVDFEKAEKQFYFDCSLDRERIDSCEVKWYNYFGRPPTIQPRYWYFPAKVVNMSSPPVENLLVLGGAAPNADFCPVRRIWKAFKPCKDDTGVVTAAIGDIYGTDSKCLDLNNKNYKIELKGGKKHLGRGACYHTKCEDGKLHFKTANMGADEWFTCEKPGDKYTGVKDTEIYCPSCNEICPDCGPGTNFKFDEPSRYHEKPPIVKPPGGGQGRTASAATGVRVSAVCVMVAAALLWFSML